MPEEDIDAFYVFATPTEEGKKRVSITFYRKGERASTITVAELSETHANLLKKALRIQLSRWGYQEQELRLPVAVVFSIKNEGAS